MDDATLAVAAREGDSEAFAAIYDRYADRIHDFCCSVLRDRAEAADAMQDTFLTAAQKLGQLRDPSKLRAWIFAIARHESLRRAKARSRATPTDDFPDLAAPGAGPEDAVRRAELSEIVWAAAAGLSERDRALLDLHLRQGLDGQELADTIGVTPGHAYVLMNRLRTQVERALGALLVARLGRDDCETLAGILTGWDGTFSVLIRKRVARHVDGCDLCGSRRRSLVSPLSLLAAVPIVPAARGLREQVLSRIELTSAGSPVASGSGGADAAGGTRSRFTRHIRGERWRSDGFPPAMIASRAARRLAVMAAALVVFGGGGFLALRGTTPKNGDVTAGPQVSTPWSVPAPATSQAPSRATTTTIRSSATSAAASGSTPAPSPSTTAGAPLVTTPTTPLTPTTAPPSASTAPATTTTAATDNPPHVEIVNVTNPEIYQDGGGCTPTESYFEAIASDDRAVQGVSISWTSKSGSGSADMVSDNNRWYGTVGPFAAIRGSRNIVDVTVSAIDSADQVATTSSTITLVYGIAGYC